MAVSGLYIIVAGAVVLGGAFVANRRSSTPLGCYMVVGGLMLIAAGIAQIISSIGR